MGLKFITNSMIYKFRCTSSKDLNKWKNFRFGKIYKLITKDKEYCADVKEESHYIRGNYYRIADQIQKIEMVIKYEKAYNPYPDFLTVGIAFRAINHKAKEFLDQNNITYKTIPTEIRNDKHSYEMVIFPTKSNLIDLTKGNVVLNQEGYLITEGYDYFSPVKAELYFKRKILQLKGLYQIPELHGMHICDESIKEKLEKSGLTAFTFDKINIAE